MEFYPIDLTLSRRAANWELFDANSSTYAAGLRDSLEEHHGIYVFFDSRGKSTRNQPFIPACDQRRRIVECNVYLADIATYFSAYSVADEFIDVAESLLIRCFPNNLLNKRMEQGVFGNN